MIIRMEDIRGVFDILIARAIESGLQEMETNTDYYWTILDESRHKFDLEIPPEPAVGSLNDDLESLRKILNGSNPATLIDFNRLANVLIAIAESISKSNKIYI